MQGKRTKPPVGELGAQANRPLWRRLLPSACAVLLTPFVGVYLLQRISGNDGLASVLAEECAVIVNHWTGSQRLVNVPGYQPFVPWFQEVFRFDKSPNAFVMQGNAHVDANHVPRVLVRSQDGSSFWFQEIALQYQLVVDAAPHVLEDSGPADGYKQELVRAFARSILRDEFGRFAMVDIVRPENLQLATRASLERMNAALAPHGIEVVEVSTPKPAFDKEYEGNINRRKMVDQEVPALSAALAEIQAERPRAEQVARGEKALELQKLIANLARDTSAAQAENKRARAEADNNYAEKLSQGRALKRERELQTAVLTEKYQKLADDARERAEKLRKHGLGSVRAALVEKLAQIQFNLVPFNRDPAAKGDVAGTSGFGQ